MFKYMTWTEGSYFQGNQLLSREQINSLLETFSGKKSDQFVTIQDYDSDGSIIGCPLYFDIDSPSLFDAYTEMQSLVAGIKCEFGIEPLVYFSGGKGFHVMAPLYIRHKRCHEIVKMIWQDLFPAIECDPKVYRARSMFRCNGTWNVKGERYKVLVSSQLTLESMIRDSLNGRQSHPPGWITEDMDVEEYIEQLPVFKQVEFDGNSDFVSDIMPCLKNLWLETVPPEGTRHELAHLMVRHAFRTGLDRDSTIALFTSHPFWSQVNRRDYEKIVRSVYQTGKAHVGCNNNDYLQSNCVKFCKYNKGMSIKDTFKQGESR
jgi:hypothetical protein